MGLNGSWKWLERQAARFFGAERIPLSGMAKSLKSNSDTMHEVLYIEAKYRKNDVYMWSMFEEAEDSANSYYSASGKKYRKSKDSHKAIAILITQPDLAGYLLLLHSNHLEIVGENSDKGRNGKVKWSVKEKKHFASVTLFIDTEQKAKIESKIPVVALKQRNKDGFLLLFKAEDLTRIYHERKNRKQNND